MSSDTLIQSLLEAVSSLIRLEFKEEDIELLREIDLSLWSLIDDMEEAADESKLHSPKDQGA